MARTSAFGVSRATPASLSRDIPSLDIGSDSWSVVTLSRLDRLGCRPGRSSQTETIIKELQMLRMNILGLGALLILGTADVQAQVDPDQQAGTEQEVGRRVDTRARRDSDRTRPDVRPDTRPDTRPDVRPDARRPRIDRRPDVAPTRGRRDVRPVRAIRR